MLADTYLSSFLRAAIVGCQTLVVTYCTYRLTARVSNNINKILRWLNYNDYYRELGVEEVQNLLQDIFRQGRADSPAETLNLIEQRVKDNDAILNLIHHAQKVMSYEVSYEDYSSEEYILLADISMVHPPSLICPELDALIKVYSIYSAVLSLNTFCADTHDYLMNFHNPNYTNPFIKLAKMHYSMYGLYLFHEEMNTWQTFSDLARMEWMNGIYGITLNYGNMLKQLDKVELTSLENQGKIVEAAMVAVCNGKTEKAEGLINQLVSKHLTDDVYSELMLLCMKYDNPTIAACLIAKMVSFDRFDPQHNYKTSTDYCSEYDNVCKLISNFYPAFCKIFLSLSLSATDCIMLDTARFCFSKGPSFFSSNNNDLSEKVKLKQLAIQCNATKVLKRLIETGQITIDNYDLQYAKALDSKISILTRLFAPSSETYDLLKSHCNDLTHLELVLLKDLITTESYDLLKSHCDDLTHLELALLKGLIGKVITKESYDSTI